MAQTITPGYTILAAPSSDLGDRTKVRNFPYQGFDRHGMILVAGKVKVDGKDRPGKSRG